MPDLQASAAAVTKALKPLLGESVQEFGALITDEVRLWRWSRQLKIIDRASRILQQRGIEPKPIHFKVLVPLLDSASLEEEPDLEEMWARLLASASENNSEKTFYFIATDILKNISSNEALFLKSMYGKWKSIAAGADFDPSSENTYISTNIVSVPLMDMLYESKLSLRKGMLLADNLMRLNLIWHNPKPPGGGIVFTQNIGLRSQFQLTHLAIQLMAVCGEETVRP